MSAGSSCDATTDVQTSPVMASNAAAALSVAFVKAVSDILVSYRIGATYWTTGGTRVLALV